MSIEQSFRLPFTLPSFNDLESAARRRDRIYGNGYNRLKSELQPQIVNIIRRAKVRALLPGVLLSFTWVERDRRRDPLDVRPASKLIVDALCGEDRPGDRQARAGVIHCDGWHCIRGVVDAFDVAADGRASGVVVTLYARPRVPIVAPPGWPFEVEA